MNEDVEAAVEQAAVDEGAASAVPTLEPDPARATDGLPRLGGLLDRLDPRYRIPVAVGGAALVIVLVASVAFALASGPGPAPSLAMSPVAAAPSPSGSEEAVSPSATSSPLPTTTPEPTATPAPTPTAEATAEPSPASPESTEPPADTPGPGGSGADGVVIYGGVTQTGTNRYLAGCAATEDVDPVVCSSHDLVHWSIPAPAADLHVDGAGFWPGDNLQVKSGYAVRASDDQGNEVEWYSADGVNWKPGIPDAQRVARPPDPCEAGAVSDCTGLDTETASADGRTVVAVYDAPVDANHYVFNRVAVSRDGGATWSKASLPAWAWQVMAPPVVDSSGHWVASFTVLPAPAPPGAVIGGTPATQLITSSDGIHWADDAHLSDASWAASAGSAIYVTTYAGLERSTDGGKTWQEVRDSSGGSIAGDWVQVVGDKILVYQGGMPTDPSTLIWVGP
jgi:hypothetical protein